MTDATTISSARAVEPGPRLHGAIDVIRTDRVAGWVIDRSDPAAHASVEIRRDGRVIATLAADRPRQDLERQGVGTGRYGFSLALDPPLDKGMEFTLTATARSHDGVEQTLQPVRGPTSPSVEQRVLAQILVETTDLRQDIAGFRAEWEEREADGTPGLADRLEIGQLRLEAALARAETPPAASQVWLWIVALSGAVLGLTSLAVGLLSLWRGQG